MVAERYSLAGYWKTSDVKDDITEEGIPRTLGMDVLILYIKYV